MKAAGVIGAGTMGAGIAYVLAAAGYGEAAKRAGLQAVTSTSSAIPSRAC